MNGLSIIVPSRNTTNLIVCLRELAKFDGSHRVIVIDDGLDHSHPALAYGMPERLEFVSGVKPFVFSRNVNLGIQAAGEDDVVILNDDALLEAPGGFTMLQRVAEEHPEFGLIAASCNHTGNMNQWKQNIGLREDPRMVCFIAVLIRRRTIDTVGLLDEGFVGYGCDDDDYCLRVRKAGLKIGIHDDCYVDHGSLKSTFRGSGGAEGDYRGNLRRFIKKWGCDLFGNAASVY